MKGVHRQYAVEEPFPSITDGEDNDCVEFRWKDEA